MEDFEIGVYDAELYYSNKYDEWLELRRNQLELFPDDHYTKYRFVEALIKVGRYEEALNYLKKLHNEDPEEEEFNQQIVDILRIRGQKKEDFNWKIMPTTLLLNEELEEHIIKQLKSKRRRKESLEFIYIDLMSYLLEFNKQELFEYLKSSENFEVNGDTWFDSVVQRRK